MAKLSVLFACEECKLCETRGYAYPEGFCVDLEKEIADIGKFHEDCELDDAKDISNILPFIDTTAP